MVSPLIKFCAQVSPSFLLDGIFTEKSLAAIGAVVLFYLGYIVKKEILPLLKVKRNREMASHLLVIADDVTDYFRMKFPKAHWSIWLDKAVDRIIEITGVKPDVAGRAARASLSRKKDPGAEEGD